MAAGDPASYEKDNRKAWWPGELSLEGGAASSVYRCASHQLSLVRNGQAIWITSNQMCLLSMQMSALGPA